MTAYSPSGAVIQPACVECSRPATGYVLVGVAVARIYYCADPTHQLCARRAAGYADTATAPLVTL